MPLITTVEYPAIRAAIDVGLNSRKLPDAIIALAIYQGAAEVEVIDRVPTAQALVTTGGAPARAIKNAVIYLTAAAIAPALTQLLSRRIGDVATTNAKVDWEARAADLRARAAGELGLVAEPVAVASLIPSLFTVAHGGRGAW